MVFALDWLGIEAPALIKIFVFLGIWGIIWLPVAFLIALRYQWRPFAPPSAAQKLPLLGSLYLVAPLWWMLLIKIEGATASDFGWRWNEKLFQSLGLGMAIAIGGLLVIYGLAYGLGWYGAVKEKLSRVPALILPLLGLGLWIGGTEEFIFRGIFYSQLRQDYAGLMAAAISSVIFALLHLIWEREQTLPQLPGLWLMGMVLVWARSLDGDSLGLAWGLHAGWIWGLSLLDGAEFLQVTGRSPEWVTGLDKQPLAGLMGLVCLLLTALAIGQLPQG